MMIRLILLSILYTSQNPLRIQQSFFSERVSASRTTSLTNEPPNGRLLHLEVDAILSSTVQIRSDMISLKGRHTTLSFTPVLEETLNTPHFSQNRSSSKQRTEQSAKSNKPRDIATQFMFDVSNSTFWIDGMDLKSDTEGNGEFDHITRILFSVCDRFVGTVGTVVRTVWFDCASFRRDPPLHIELDRRNNDDSPDSADGISVVGMNVALESKMLLSGTGPLFSFGLFEHGPYHHPVRPSLEMETDLINSHLFNISSQSSPSRTNSGGLLFGSNVNQRLVGCSISRSSNHQRGTSMMDPNLGGCLLYQNTSFSKGVSQSNAGQTISYENRIQGQRYVLSDKTVESITFTLCTFDDMR
ncbi:hypothetical protein BLNAU_14181 [Blattamonas nauphoetae]|uniref:Uncharacterized protein n=1 Tax=Blattamonas nauphoetae TaxID=2049346 RepID=A0ABQ9XHH1_9EUKA|nr:hypothetical protein BLNAU_14181 [Blattamonas nauphoetae]